MALSKDNQNRLRMHLHGKVGRPYEYGAKWPLKVENPDGPVDCSGFSRWALSLVGRILPDGSRAQHLFVKYSPEWVSSGKTLSVGCLGFSDGSDTDEETDHVVVYAGNGEVIESRGGKGVIIRPSVLWEKWKGWKGWFEPT